MNYVFITGAAGFIGQNIVKKFIAENWHVIALVHNNIPKEFIALEKKGVITLVKGDACNLATFSEKLLTFNRANKINAIIHAAAYASDMGRKNTFRENNFEATQNLVTMAKTLCVEKFIFISTTDVYGIKDFNGETEDELPYCNNRKNFYPEYKIKSEEWLKANFSQKKYVIIRPAAVWGVDDKTLTQRIIDFLSISPFMIYFGKWKGLNRWPLAHVKNVALAVFLAATEYSALGKAINVLDSEKIAISDFYEMLQKIYFPNKNFFRLYIPLLIINPIAIFITFVSRLLNLKKPLIDPSYYALHSVSCNLDFSNERFLQLVEKSNNKMVTYDEGVKELNEHAYEN